jgi:predicted RNase H-like nuclease
MPTFIGLDLAWTTRNESGICWLEGDSRENLRCTRLDTAICDTQTLADEVAAVDGPLVVTIDAPVVYSLERSAERKIASIFGRYKAGPHQAHYAVRRGYQAGIDLGYALAKRGFTLNPGPLLNGNRNRRSAVEVFPHTIHVRLFDLDERILYKKGRVAQKRTGLRQYQGHLEALLEREAPNLLSHPDVACALDAETAQNAKGKSIKRLDDTLDGLTCALAAWLIWKEPERWEMIGDLNGYIVVPKAQDG